MSSDPVPTIKEMEQAFHDAKVDYLVSTLPLTPEEEEALDEIERQQHYRELAAGGGQSAALAFDDAVRIASGCTDYGGAVSGGVSGVDGGGPAFPWGGMTLRDYFAAKAMQGEVAACLNQRAKPEEVAKFAYDVADAMLRARTALTTQGESRGDQ